MTPAPGAKPSSLSRVLGRAVLVRPGEGRLLLWSTGYFFFLLFSYYLLRPMREAFGIARGADKLPWLMTGTMAVMFLANPVFAALVSRLPRRRFIPLAYRFCGATMAGFYLLFKYLPAHGGAALGYVFYIWLSVFNLFAVSMFWAFMSDGFDEDQGKRLFSFIAVGGTLGGILGAATTGALTQGVHLGTHLWKLQATTLLLLAIVALELAVQCAVRLARRFLPAGAPSRNREPGPGMFEGLRLFLRSPYLALMGLYILLFTITSTLLYMQQGSIVAKAFTSQAARTAAFARIDFWVNVLTLFSQVFLASRLITGLGLRTVLCLMPVLTAVGFGALWAWPTFAVLVVFQVLRRGLHYAVDRPAREVLYIPLGPDERYKSKPFIDTFVYRGGDLLGTWLPNLLALGAVPVGAVALALSGLWLGAGRRLGTLQRRLKP
jgi:AAA family ATP:ADP antiporter